MAVVCEECGHAIFLHADRAVQPCSPGNPSSDLITRSERCYCPGFRVVVDCGE